MSQAHRNTILFVCLTLTFVVDPGRTVGADDSVASSPAADPMVPIPEGYLLISEDAWYQLADEPDIHFLAGRRDYLRNEPIDSANSIRKGTAILMLAAAHARGEPKKKLQASILELETLATKLDHDNVRSARSLDRIFCRSFFALANYNEAEARRHLKLEEAEKAEKHLRAASRNVVHAAAWRGVELEDNVVETLQDLERAASRLATEGSKGFDAAIQSLDALHTHFEKLKKLQSDVE